MKPLLKNQALVAGEWITHPETFHVQNPATQGVIATLPNLSAQHVEASLAAAEEAGKVWGKTSIQERNQILLRWRDLITQHKDELAQILSLEQGKLFKQAMDEINFAGACLDFVTKEAEQTIFEEETATGFVIKKKTHRHRGCPDSMEFSLLIGHDQMRDKPGSWLPHDPKTFRRNATHCPSPCGFSC